MSRTYKAVGINLKSMPLGESDRLLTILTQEFGLIRAVAPGVRKHHSKLGGRSELFVVNELLLAKGRSLDKITQAETTESYPGLSRDLGKLAASQYLAEIILVQALSEQPQADLFHLLNEHLRRLEKLPANSAYLVLAHLCQAIFHLLVLAGITPQVQACCLTQQLLTPDFGYPGWQVGFSVPAGGTVSLAALERLQLEERQPKSSMAASQGIVASATSTNYQTIKHRQATPVLNTQIGAIELALLQQLAGASLEQSIATPPQSSAINSSWIAVEQILRQYTQYHLGRPIRSAALIDSYFASEAEIFNQQ